MYHLAKSLYFYATSKEEYSILLLGLDNAGKTTLLSTIKSLYHPSHPSPANKTVPTVGQNVCTIDLPDMYLKIWDVGGQHALRGLWTKYYGSCHAIVFVIDSSDVGDGELDDALLEEDEDDDDDDDNDDDDDSEGEDDDEGEDFNTLDTASGVGKKPEKSRKQNKKKTKKILPTTTTTASGGGGVAHREDEGGRLAECALVLSSVLSSTSTTGIPVLVLANKQDREDCVETVRIKEGLVRKVFEGGGEGGGGGVDEAGGGGGGGGGGGAVRDSRVLPVSALKGTGVREAVEWVRSRVKWNREGRPPVMR